MASQILLVLPSYFAAIPPSLVSRLRSQDQWMCSCAMYAHSFVLQLSHAVKLLAPRQTARAFWYRRRLNYFNGIKLLKAPLCVLWLSGLINRFYPYWTYIFSFSFRRVLNKASHVASFVSGCADAQPSHSLIGLVWSIVFDLKNKISLLDFLDFFMVSCEYFHISYQWPSYCDISLFTQPRGCFE